MDTEDTAGVWISYDNRCMLCLREDGKFKDREHAIHLLNQLQKAGMEGTIVRR